MFTMCSTSSIKLESRNVAAVQSALQRNVPESVQSLLFCLFKLFVAVAVVVAYAPPQACRASGYFCKPRFSLRFSHTSRT